MLEFSGLCQNSVLTFISLNRCILRPVGDNVRSRQYLGARGPVTVLLSHAFWSLCRMIAGQALFLSSSASKQRWKSSSGHQRAPELHGALPQPGEPEEASVNFPSPPQKAGGAPGLPFQQPPAPTKARGSIPSSLVLRLIFNRSKGSQRHSNGVFKLLQKNSR